MEKTKKKILIVTSSVFTDRMLQFSPFLNELKGDAEIEVSAKSFITNPNDWSFDNIKVSSLPRIKPLPNWTSYLRRINEFAWTQKLDAESIKINYKYKVKKKPVTHFLKTIGNIIAFFNMQSIFESFLFIVVNRFNRNKNIQDILIEKKVDCLIVMNPFWVEEPLIAVEALKLKIPVISIIPSWDNITTKSRMLYKSSAYGVWSSVRIKELHKYYPYSKKVNYFTFGTPQYDIFKNKEYLHTKEYFYNKYDLDINLPVILYTLGSPLFIKSEIDVCLQFCKLAHEKGTLDKCQILVRPHPIKDFSEFVESFNSIDSRIRLQVDVQTPKEQKIRFMNSEMLKNWVSTFYFSDLIIATSSTTLLDGAMLNKPHINITANLTDDKNLDSFLFDISNKFIHLKDLNDLELLNNVTNWEDFMNEIDKFIKDKDSLKNNSKEIVKRLAEFSNDNFYGKIFADEIKKIIYKC